MLVQISILKGKMSVKCDEKISIKNYNIFIYTEGYFSFPFLFLEIYQS